MVWTVVVGRAGAASGLGSGKPGIRIVGSTTVLPLVERAAEAYRQLHPGVQILVSAGGSGVGLNSVREGLADIGMMSRELETGEKKFKNRPLLVLSVVIDAVTCVVSSEIYGAGITSLRREDIRAIYAGEISNWKELGERTGRLFVSTRRGIVELATSSCSIFLAWWATWTDCLHPFSIFFSPARP